MKIKIINTTNKEKLTLENLLLSASNPRYSILNSFNDNLVDFITKNDKEESQKKTFHELLKSEGDFSDFLALIKSIKKMSFVNISDSIILVQKERKNFVAEGNRRIMVLKLLEGSFILPNFTYIKNEILSYENENEILINENEEDDDLDLDLVKKAYKNYEDSKNYIEKIKEDLKEEIINVYVEIVDDSDILWRKIYQKHLNGEKPGMRKWSRAKYFTDLLSIFRDGININDEDDINLIYKNIEREPKIIIQDFKNAQFVYSCFWFSEYKNEKYKNAIAWDDQEILNKIKNSRRISALEINHSFNKIRKMIIENILFEKTSKSTRESFEENYFKIEFKKNNRIKFLQNKIHQNIFLNMIYKNWEAGRITTRPFTEENHLYILNELKLILMGLNDSLKLDTEKISKINFFDMDLNKVKEIYNYNLDYFEKTDLFPLKIVIDIKDNNNIFVNNLKEKLSDNKIHFITNDENIEPIFIFDYLNEEMKFLKNHKYLDAIAFSLRSFLEHICEWTYLKFLKQSGEIKKFEENLEKICTGHSQIVFKKFKEGNNFRKSFSTCIKNSEKLDEFSKFFEANKTYIVSVLNEYIHSMPTLYLKNEYQKNLEKIKEWQKFIIDLYTFFDFNELKEINEEIINYLQTISKKMEI